MDAAARDARQTFHHLSDATEVTRENAPPVVTRLLAMCQEAIVSRQVDLCPHIRPTWESGSAIPVYWVAWRPDRAACEKCYLAWLAPDSPDKRCDLCHGHQPTDFARIVKGPAIILANLCAECRGDSAHSDDSSGLEQDAISRARSGRYADAVSVQRRLVEALEQSLGSDHPDTLLARGRLANWIGEAGDAAGACDQLAALLAACERVLGLEHRATLVTRGNLANWMGAAGDAAGARDQYAVLLAIFERTLGPEDPATLTARSNLAALTGRAGDAAGARDHEAALLAVKERILGPEHPDTLTTRGDVARWTEEAGDVTAARDQYAALLVDCERVLGPGHRHDGHSG